VRELVAGHPTLLLVAEALLAAHAALGEQLSKLEKRVRSLARDDRRVRRLMSAPGVGAVVALTFVAAIDDPARFRSSKGDAAGDARRDAQGEGGIGAQAGGCSAPDAGRRH